MYSNLERSIPLPIPKEELIDVAQKAKDFALLNGLIRRSSLDVVNNIFQIEPFILTPSSFPRAQFREIMAVQRLFNDLIYRVAHDDAFLTLALQKVVRLDEFTGKLFETYRRFVDDKDAAPQTDMGIIRCDFLLENENKDEGSTPCEACGCKLIKITAMDTAMGHKGPATRTLHQFTVRELADVERSDSVENNMPMDTALHGICRAIRSAWELYKNQNAVVLFVVSDIAFDIADERFHEYYMRQTYPEIRIIRRTLSAIGQTVELDSNTNTLRVDKHEVAVVYFRTGNEPWNYATSKDWDLRYLMEVSRAIKCPPLCYQLATQRKVLQVLSQPGILEVYVENPLELHEIRKFFTGMYPIDESEYGKNSIKRVLEDPEKFILRPLRYGSEGNIYGKDISIHLANMTPKERGTHIIMDKIRPPITKGYLIRPNGEKKPPLMELKSEIGIFGIIIGNADDILSNRQVGHVMRSKVLMNSTGTSFMQALDSPYLAD